MKVKLDLNAESILLKANVFGKVNAEMDGIELVDLVEAVDDNAEILKVIGIENIAEWVSEENGLSEMLDYFDDVAIADYLRANGWEFSNDSDN